MMKDTKVIIDKCKLIFKHLLFFFYVHMMNMYRAFQQPVYLFLINGFIYQISSSFRMLSSYKTIWINYCYMNTQNIQFYIYILFVVLFLFLLLCIQLLSYLTIWLHKYKAFICTTFIRLHKILHRDLMKKTQTYN